MSDETEALYKAVLRQIMSMYENPDLKRVCIEAMSGNWESALYEKYRPATFEVKNKKRQKD